MKQVVCLGVALFCSGLAAAKDPVPVTYPLPAGTPIEYVRDSQATLVLFAAPYGKNQQSPGGIFGASWIVDNQRKIEPLRKELEPAKLDEYFLQAVLTRTPALVVSAAPSVVAKAWTDDEVIEKTRDSGGVYVVLRSFHAFTLGFEALGGYVDMSVLRAERKSSGKLKVSALDHQRISFEQHFQGWKPSLSRGTSMSWRLLGAPKVEVAFREAIDQAANMFAYQFSAEGQTEARLKNRKPEGKVLDMKVPVRLVRTGPDWFWFREDYEDQLVGYRIIETSSQP